MKSTLRFFIFFFVGISLLLIYYPWFGNREIIGGDWPYYFQENLREFPFFVHAWTPWQVNGMGGVDVIYFLNSFQYVTFFLSNFLHIPWNITYKIVWFGLFLFLSFFTSFYLVKRLFSKVDVSYSVLGGFLYTTNTYILMVVGGGQMGVALGYAVAPFVISQFINCIQTLQVPKIRYSLLAGLVLALQVLFDPRIAYITMSVVVLYVFFTIIPFLINKNNLREKVLFVFRYGVYVFLIPLGITMLLHLFWILPLFLLRQNATGAISEAYTTSGMVKFLSFANFSDSFSLLHPNWPENIFGKTYFMRPQFLLLPFFAYASLLLISSREKYSLTIKKTILFFAGVGILGAFLGKGANPPFGEIYLFLFDYFPGFIAFRDPTKWYIMVALAFSLLIPFSLYTVIERIKKTNIHSSKKYFLTNVVIFCIIGYLFFLISPAILGQLSGTFEKQEMPREYIIFKNFLSNQKDFSRTLWIPRQQRFSFYSSTHPPVEAIHLMKATNSAEAIRKIDKAGPNFLAQYAIKYVIVPYDSTEDIFIKDRKYNEKEYLETIHMLEKITWLKRITGFGKIAVFETPKYNDHFWLTGKGKINYTMIDPSHYKITVDVPHSQKLIFSENYNKYWQVKIADSTSNAQKTQYGLNSFYLNNTGKFMGEVVFIPVAYYWYGRIISFLTLLGVLLLLIKYRNQ